MMDLDAANGGAHSVMLQRLLHLALPSLLETSWPVLEEMRRMLMYQAFANTLKTAKESVGTWSGMPVLTTVSNTEAACKMLELVTLNGTHAIMLISLTESI
jgi:hypothetical protein